MPRYDLKQKFLNPPKGGSRKGGVTFPNSMGPIPANPRQSIMGGGRTATDRARMATYEQQGPKTGPSAVPTLTEAFQAGEGGARSNRVESCKSKTEQFGGQGQTEFRNYRRAAGTDQQQEPSMGGAGGTAPSTSKPRVVGTPVGRTNTD